MPHLVSKRRLAGPVINLVADEVKHAATQIVLTLSEPLDTETFQKLVKYHISLWHEVVPPELQDAYRTEAAGYKSWINLVDVRQLLEWVIEARPDLRPAINTADGRLWFYQQWATTKRELRV